MLPSLLILSVSLQLAWTCLPMKPAEDMHCPSVPLAAAVDGYVVNGLVKKIVNGAEVYSCTPADAVLLEVDGTTVNPITGGTISCNPNSGIFVDDKNMAVNQKKYNCGKMAECGTCQITATSFYDDGETSLTNIPIRVDNICVITCPDGFSMTVDNMGHDRVVCDIFTNDVKVDSEDGKKLSQPQEFKCANCQCSIDVMNDGKAGLCPLNKLCIKPVNPKKCEATCPPDSKAIYKKDMALLTSDTIKCVTGTPDWIVAGYDSTAGITCQFNDGKGYTEQPPADALVMCPELELQDCPLNKGCRSSELIYIGDGQGGYTATCKSGTLITNLAPDAEMDGLTISCTVGNNEWVGGYTKANCLTDNTQVEKCMMGLPVGLTKFDCSFGLCSVTCVDETKMLSYMTGSGMKKTAYLMCKFEELSSPDSDPVTDAPNVQCVA